MASQADRFAGVIELATSKVIGRLQLRMMQALTTATPVDTGFARSG